MCGIIGTSNLNCTEEKMQVALKEIFKRGPDNIGVEKNEFVFFGHTRLSILDLETRSNQPFKYSHKGRSFLITFNGEIYNYISIKEKLINKGYRFRTTSDTEVICAAYCEYGIDCFDFFEGMWAMAINDGSNLIVSRDRLGKKPLYLSHLPGEPVFFGSSLKSVSIISDRSKLNSEGVELYFALGFIPKHYTIIKNISKVEPGFIHHYEIKNQICNLINVSKSIFKPQNNIDKLSVKEIIYSSVEKRLISDVPFTSLVSGGVDSTIVTCITNELKTKIEAYFVDFVDIKFSENKWANYLANKNGINLNTVLMGLQELNIAFKEYYSVYEEPFADYSGIPSIAIFKEVSKKYKIVLTGDGGDELFYGYPHYYKKYILLLFFDILKFFNNFGILTKKVKTIVEQNKKEFESNYLKNHGIITPFAASIINMNFNDSIKKSKSYLKGIIAYDRDFYNLPEKYLVKLDRASMFSGVEVRSPFMDENLSAKVQKISTIFLFTPYSSKLFLKIGFFKLFGLKYFFKSKRGFTPPIEGLRVACFREEDYLNLKIFLKTNVSNVYTLIEKIDYSKLEKDKILFDRFFFFNEWKNNSKIFNLNQFESANF